jgi:arsenate reductase
MTAGAEGAQPIRVLFVCTHNSARSQMAEALLRRHGGDAFEVTSAGTEPGRVHPLAIQAMAEVGIDMSDARSKSVAQFLDEPFDYVITVCDQARQVCPVFPGAHESLHWDYADPSIVEGSDEERLAAFRRTATAIAERIHTFVVLARRRRHASAATLRADRTG